MKILFLINNLGVGGAEGVFKRDAEALANLGFQTEIYFLYPNNFKNLYDIRGYVTLIKKIRREKIDIVYSTLDDANFVAKVVRIFTTFKLFCREANMTEDKSLKFKITDVILNFLVHKLVMVAEAVKNSYASYDPLHKNKMAVLYNGVAIPAVYRKARENIGLVKIIAVGSFTKKKGIEDLVLIFKDYIFPKNKNFMLQIVGDGPLFNSVSERIKEYGLEDKIKCPGALSKNVLEKFYLDSDIFVLTSKKEGCPNVLLEAGVYGLAPVCFSVGAVPEIIENGISGIVVPKDDKKAFGEAILSLMEDMKRINKMGERARVRIANNFSCDLHIKNLLKILDLDK